MQTKAQKNGNGKMKHTRKLIPIGNTSENSPSKKKMYLVLPPMRCYRKRCCNRQRNPEEPWIPASSSIPLQRLLPVRRNQGSSLTVPPWQCRIPDGPRNSSREYRCRLSSLLQTYLVPDYDRSVVLLPGLSHRKPQRRAYCSYWLPYNRRCTVHPDETGF